MFFAEQKKMMVVQQKYLVVLSLGVCFFFLSALTKDTGHGTVAFPLQFSASIQITANLIDEKSAYPPRIRRMQVHYDYIKKRARADIDEGYEVEKTCTV